MRETAEVYQERKWQFKMNYSTPMLAGSNKERREYKWTCGLDMGSPLEGTNVVVFQAAMFTGKQTCSRIGDENIFT